MPEDIVSDTAKTIPILTAPTASGKTALALQLAQETGHSVELVCADAFTVYRGLDIGTAKPTSSEREAVPHHLLDVAEVTEDFDVVRFVALAEAAIADIMQRGAVPLVVGGTGFYLSGLVRGLPKTPPVDPVLRRQIEAELQERGLDVLLDDIAQNNPVEAKRMERNPRRIVRATEVFRRTGKYPGEWGYSNPRFSYQVFGFALEKDELQSRLQQRTQTMLKGGWPAEAEWLASKISSQQEPRPTAWQALGYPEALQVAKGRLSIEEATKQIVLSSRQYAKRQQTWIRKQLGVELLTTDRVQEQLRGFLSSFR